MKFSACALLFASASAVMIRSDHIEHCPDYSERYTLVNGRDIAVEWPKVGYNCYSLA